MTEPTPGPLDPIVAALIAAERADPPVAPSAVRDAVRARVRASIAAGAASRVDPPGVHRAATGLRTALQWSALVGLGAAIGATAHARFATPHERVVYVRTVVERAVPAAPVVPDASRPSVLAIATDAATDAPVAMPRRGESLPTGHVVGDLDAERALLDRARSALLRGRADDALDAIQRRDQRFAHGQLAEEFESLRVQALVAGGRFEDARAAGERFHQHFGNGLLGPVVDAALRRIP